MSTIRELMQSEPLTVLETTPIIEVVRIFVRAGLGGAPVVDADGRVAGIITIRDLMRAVDQAFDEDIDPGEPDNNGGPAERALRAATAGDLASRELVWVTERTAVADAARTMRERGIHHLLVGEAGRLAGVLTSFDLLAALPS